MSKGYIRKETVLAFLRVCRVRMNDLMTVHTMESNHEAAQAAYTCRCYLDEEIQQVKKHPAAAVVKIKREGKTRADRVRAMTDEELADLLQQYACPDDLGGENQCEKRPLELVDKSICRKCWLDCLKTED
jgi:hypothetical protein